MNHLQAKAEARRRFGTAGFARVLRPLPPEVLRCNVGQKLESEFRIYGHGDTWEKAFNDATARLGTAVFQALMDEGDDD
jgi:hypothetical protein